MVPHGARAGHSRRGGLRIGTPCHEDVTRLCVLTLTQTMFG